MASVQYPTEKVYSNCRQPDYSFDVSVQAISYISKILFLFYFVSLQLNL